MKQIVIISARSFGREIYSIFNQIFENKEEYTIKGFLDDDKNVLNEFPKYPPVLGSVDDYEIKADDFFVCAIGNPITKNEFINKIKLKGGRFVNLIHPTSVIGLNVKLGEGIILGPFSYIGNDSTVGDYVTIQSHVAIGHDVRIGEYNQINAFAFLGGYVKLGNFVSIHPGAKIAPKIKIGNKSIIGINSAVIRSVSDGVTVFGNPAKKVLY